MLTDKVNLVSAHIDYFRASWEVSGDDEGILRNLESIRREALAELGKRKEKARPAALYGYYGGMQEGLFLGMGPQGILLQASGVVSDFVAGRCTGFSNIPRLDIAVTLWSGVDASVHIDRAEKAFVGYRGPNGGRPAKPRRVSTYGSGDTMYSGQRGSKNYIIRVYDKGRASGEDVYEGAVRYEVELTNEQARLAYEGIAEAGFGHWACLETARSYLRERGLVLPVSRETPEMPVYRLPKARGGLERRLEWLRESVAPSLDLLRENGYTEDGIAEVLGIGRG